MCVIHRRYDEETDDSEEPSKDSGSGAAGGEGSVGDLRNLDDDALHALTQKAPKNAKYNFYVDLRKLLIPHLYIARCW